MGQYFEFVNLDKKEFIKCFDFGDSLKEMEHSYVGNDYVRACVNLLNNRWKGDRVIHLGDYADELFDVEKFKPLLEKIVKETGMKKDPKYDCYQFSELWSEKNKLGFKKLDPSKVGTQDFRYILVDNDKYIDRYKVKLGEYPSEKPENSFWKWTDDNGVKHAGVQKVDNFTLAIALGEGSGGSYYFEENSIQEKLHGSLSGHRFSSTNIKPTDREEINLEDFGYFTLKQVLVKKNLEDLKLFLNEKEEIEEKLTEDEIKDLNEIIKIKEKQGRERDGFIAGYLKLIALDDGIYNKKRKLVDERRYVELPNIDKLEDTVSRYKNHIKTVCEKNHILTAEFLVAKETSISKGLISNQFAYPPLKNVDDGFKYLNQIVSELEESVENRDVRNLEEKCMKILNDGEPKDKEEVEQDEGPEL